MKMPKTIHMLLIAGCLAGITAVGNYFYQPDYALPVPPKALPDKAAVIEFVPSKTVSVDIDWTAVSLARRDDVMGPPPPPQTPPVDVSVLNVVRLLGIVDQGSTRHALIEVAGATQMLHIGAEYKGWRVDRIVDDRIVFTNAGQFHELLLWAQDEGASNQLQTAQRQRGTRRHSRRGGGSGQ